MWLIALQSDNIMAPYNVHPTAVIDHPCKIGAGTKVWHFSHLMAGSRIGEDCILGQNVYVDRDVQIGNRCKIQNNVSVYKGVILEDDVFCGPSVVFTNVINPRAYIERKDEFKPTIISRGVTLGANATLMCGVVIGQFALIGAGAVVIKDFPAYALAVGVPARQVGWVCHCGVTLPSSPEPVCASCGKNYHLRNNVLEPGN